MLQRLFLVFAGVIVTACTQQPVSTTPSNLTGGAKAIDCAAQVGPPRVEKVSEHVYVAIGYDLANTVLIRTNAGNVIIDTGLSPESARRMRTALADQAPGPVAAVIFTHSHIDHVGGTSVYVDDQTPIWASAAFTAHFFKQYGMFQPLEALRSQRQYGSRIDVSEMPCTSIGARPDLTSALTSGARMPNHTFDQQKTLTIGGLTIELIEASGETHDQIMVWVPADRTLISGDNFYRAFPNLYTIRGTTPRPVDQWIESLDKMRRLEPEHLVPGHTKPLSGREVIQTALRDYRDGIQWVRDATVRGANEGKTPDVIAGQLRLPAHLSSSPFLAETYGQIGWSVRGIYDSHLGWFSGEAEDLYPAPPAVTAAGDITLMGGFDAVYHIAKQAAEGGDPRWALHLLRKLRLADAGDGSRYAAATAQALRRLAAATTNTNGRAYLLETAITYEQGPAAPLLPAPDEETLAQTPIEIFLARMASRLDTTMALGVDESVALDFTDLKRQFYLTQRYGVLEISEGAPMPGAVTPVATMSVDSRLWKKLAIGETSAISATLAGSFKLSGDRLALAAFFARFKRQD